MKCSEKNIRNAEMELGAGNIHLGRLIRQVNEEMLRIDAEAEARNLYVAEQADDSSFGADEGDHPAGVLDWMNYAQI